MNKIGIVGFDGVDDLDMIGIRTVLLKAADHLDHGNSVDTIVVSANQTNFVSCATGTVVPSEMGWHNLQSCNAIVLPGGSAAINYYPSKKLKKLLSFALTKNIPIFCICSGVFLLANSGLLDGRHVAVHNNKKEKLLSICDPRVSSGLVRDGSLWTLSGEISSSLKSITMALIILSIFCPLVLEYVINRIEIQFDMNDLNIIQS